MLAHHLSHLTSSTTAEVQGLSAISHVPAQEAIKRSVIWTDGVHSGDPKLIERTGPTQAVMLMIGLAHASEVEHSYNVSI